MPNDSSTGGYIQSTIGQAEDQSLQEFLQGIVVGLTGLPGKLVFPLWQPETPNLPQFGTNWAAVGRGTRTRDKFSTVRHHHGPDAPNGIDFVHTTEILEVLCRFYGPAAEQNSEFLAIGFMEAQNREVLQQAGYGLVEVQDSVTVPDKLHERWTYRVDVNFRLRRAQVYSFPVLDLVAAQATIKDDSGAVNEQVLVTSRSPSAPLPLFAWGLSSSTLAGWGQGNWI